MYIKLSFRKFVKGKVEPEFERFCGGDVQGYHSVQTNSKGEQDSRQELVNAPPPK